MYRLRNGVQNYDWGSPEEIPAFLGAQPDGRPVAEVWIGTHPARPSVAIDAAGAERELTEVAGPLPFMLKVLAAARPLSVQVHPSKALAEMGFAAENAAGIALDAPHRNYPDDNHKPEMVYALSTFDTLIGLRPTAEILRVLAPLDTDLTQQLVDGLRADPGFGGIVRRIEWLLTRGVSPAEIDEVLQACRRLAGLGLDVKRAFVTATEIAEHFPADAGVLISLFMNRVTLQPGEAAYLEAGVIHAHLKGLAIEVMATSDNVLRAGLTHKHIDPAGLITCLAKGMARIARVNPEPVRSDGVVFSPGGAGFALAVIQVSAADPQGIALVGEGGSSLLICTGGVVRIASDGDDTLTLARGDAVYIGPGDGTVVVSGLGEVVQAFAPSHGHSPMVDVV